MSAQATPDPRYSHPMRKYDKRAENGKHLQEINAEAKRSRKPKRRIDLAERRAVSSLRRIDAYKTPEQMFQDAIDARNYALAWTIRKDLDDRAHGKPYVAVNPATERQEPAQNSRVALAINNLQIVNQAPAPGKPRNQAVIKGEVIPSGDTDHDAQVPLVATNGGECGILHSSADQAIEAAEKPGRVG